MSNDSVSLDDEEFDELIESVPVSPDRVRVEGAKCGRHPKNVDRKVLRKLAAMGCSHREMGLILGVDRDTLADYFKEDIEIGRASGDAKLRHTIHRRALAGDDTALMIFLAKYKLGMEAKLQKKIAKIKEKHEPKSEQVVPFVSISQDVIDKITQTSATDDKKE